MESIFDGIHEKLMSYGTYKYFRCIRLYVTWYEECCRCSGLLVVIGLRFAIKISVHFVRCLSPHKRVPFISLFFRFVLFTIRIKIYHSIAIKSMENSRSSPLRLFIIAFQNNLYSWQGSRTKTEAEKR